MATSAVLRAVLLVLCAVVALAVSEVCGVSVTTDPALPLLDVPFCATPSADISNKALFVSASSDCSTTLASAGNGCSASGALAFNVTSTQLSIDLRRPVVSVPATYWCSGNLESTAILVETLQMNAIQTVPMYYPTKQQVSMSFNDATPVGTTVGFFYADGTCRVPINEYGKLTLGENRTVSINFAVNYAGLCAILSSPVKDGTNTGFALRNTLFGGPGVTISPDTGVRYTNVSVYTGNSYIYYFGLSKFKTCSDMPYVRVPQVNNAVTLALEVTKPSGAYYFCVAGGDRLYYAALNMFHVIEYGMQPNIAYAKWSTKIYPAINSTDDMQVALFNSQDCSGSTITQWVSFTEALWNVQLTGLYYACVRASSTATEVYYATTYQVVPTPILEANQFIGVRGFELVLTLSSSNTITSTAKYVVALSKDKTCTSLYSSRTVSNATALSFSLNTDAPGVLYWCVSNPLIADTTTGEITPIASYASVGSIDVRDFQITYGPLQTATAATITLDSVAVLPSGSVVAFVPALTYTCADVTGAAASAAVKATVTSSNTLTGLLLPTSGHWLMCAQLNGSSSTYTELQSVDVYGDATIKPDKLIPKMTTAFAVTGLQPLQSVFATADTDCSSDASAVSMSTADNNGAASFTITYNYTGTLLVCGAYTGMTNSTESLPVARQAAAVHSANPRAFPAVVGSGKNGQELLVMTSNAISLKSKMLFLTSCYTLCPNITTLPYFSTLLSPLQLSSDADTLTTTLTLNDNMMDTRYRVCVETNDSYVDAGTLAVTRATFTPTTAANPIALTAGQLSVLTFPSNYTSVALLNTFVVVSADVDCTGDLASATRYASGSIDASTGVTSTFSAPTPIIGTTMTLRVCIARQSELISSTYGYLDGGVLTASTFTAVNKFALSSLKGGVAGWPVPDGAVHYLAKCSGSSCLASAATATCTSASTQYAVDSTTIGTSKLSTGAYLLCQRVTIGSAAKVVGSNTTVTVLESYSMTSTADLAQLRPFVEFSATIKGGSADSVDVVVQPQSIPCGTTATAASSSQTFTFTTNVQRTLTITALTGDTPLHFCAKPSSQAADAFEVMTGTLNSYISPTYIAFPSLSSSATATLSTPAATGLQAMLARGSDCSVSISGGALTNAIDNAYTFTVPPCGTNSDLSVVYFCDVSSGVATNRGALMMLRSGNCTSNDDSAAIKARTVAPGTPITDFGVDAQFLTVTGISASSDCSAPIAAATVAASGYVPGVDESAVFYVCTTSVAAPSVSFTTQQPTLTVRNYAVTPTYARSALSVVNSGAERVVLTLDSPLPAGLAFFSSGSDCLNRIGDAAGLNTSAASAVYSYASLCGTVSICWQKVPSAGSNITSAAVAVAQFTSVTSAPLQSSTLAVVRGAFYNAAFASTSCSSSLTFPSSLSTSAAQVYLSVDQCATVLDGTSAGSDAASFTTSIASDLVAGVSTVSLCARTLAGMSTVIAGVPVAPDKVYPVSFTTGTTQGRIFMPSFASTTFWLTTSDVSCGTTSAAAATLPTFTTDASGYGTVNFVSSNGLPLPVGAYPLCYASSGSAVTLDTLNIVAPTFFDVRGTSFVTGVTSKMLMQDDLQSTDLLEGFSTASDCSALSTSYGTWSRVSATAIKVTATKAAASGAFLCARVPLNLSVAALPNAWSSTAQSLTFARSTLAVPASGFDTCTDYTLGECRPPNGGGSDATNRLTVVYGDCCNSSDEANAVGVGSMAGGTCSLHFDEAKVRRYPAHTLYSLCAWNSYDASVCATLDYVTVSTNCRTAVVKGKSMSSGTIAGITVACVAGGLAIIAAVVCAICYCRRHRLLTEGSTRSKSKKNGDDSNDSSIGSAIENDAAMCAEWSEFLNIPPEGNNCGRGRRLGASTTPAQMRRDVLLQLKKEGNPLVLRDARHAPLDTNFMDDCSELTDKFKNFVNGLPCGGSESVDDFPSAAFVNRSRHDTEKLLAQAAQQKTALVTAEGVPRNGELDKQLRVELLSVMARRNPAAKAIFLFCEEEHYARNAVEISEETAFFDLRVLSRSYKMMLLGQKGKSVLPPDDVAKDEEEVEEQGEGEDKNHAAATTTTTTADDLSDAVFVLDDVSQSSNARPGILVSSVKTSSTPPSVTLTAAQMQENSWLYRHRSELEFPWVTNNFRTLVGYRERNGERYNYVDWSFTLIDLQAFHPLHQWWSPKLPPAPSGRMLQQAKADLNDGRFAFMHPKSTVPFVKRYFMLFKVEYQERVQLETQEAIDLCVMQNSFIDRAEKLGFVRVPPKALDTTNFKAAGGEANPFARDGGVRSKTIAAAAAPPSPTASEDTTVYRSQSDGASVYSNFLPDEEE